MHEFGIAQALLETVTGRLTGDGSARIAAIRLQIGRLAGVEEEALRFAFEALAADTPAEGAELVIDKIPRRAQR